MPEKMYRKIGKDLRLGKIIAGPNTNIVFKCTNPIAARTEAHQILRIIRMRSAPSRNSQRKIRVKLGDIFEIDRQSLHNDPSLSTIYAQRMPPLQTKGAPLQIMTTEGGGRIGGSETLLRGKI